MSFSAWILGRAKLNIHGEIQGIYVGRYFSGNGVCAIKVESLPCLSQWKL